MYNLIKICPTDLKELIPLVMVSLETKNNVSLNNLWVKSELPTPALKARSTHAFRKYLRRCFNINQKSPAVIHLRLIEIQKWVVCAAYSSILKKLRQGTAGICISWWAKSQLQSKAFILQGEGLFWRVQKLSSAVFELALKKLHSSCRWSASTALTNLQCRCFWMFRRNGEEKGYVCICIWDLHLVHWC